MQDEFADMEKFLLQRTSQRWHLPASNCVQAAVAKETVHWSMVPITRMSHADESADLVAKGQIRQAKKALILASAARVFAGTGCGGGARRARGLSCPRPICIATLEASWRCSEAF